MSPPTLSPAVLPTRLLLELTTPDIPTAGLNQVTAPLLLFHVGVTTR